MGCVAVFGFGIPGAFTGQVFTATPTDATTGDTSEFGLDMTVTLGSGAPVVSGPFTKNNSGFSWNIANLQAAREYRVQASTNLLLWIDLTNFIPAGANLVYTDSNGTNFSRRFYRAVSP